MSGDSQSFRLLTRADFDGLVCAVLLRQLGIGAEMKFVHPKDMQDGLIAVNSHDITANLPFVDGVYLAFDHHASELLRVGHRPNFVVDPSAPSTARVLYDYYGGSDRFPSLPPEMLDAVDKGDSADFSREEVLQPDGWTLLNFLIDARTGLGRFRNFRISTQQLLIDLIEYCLEYSIDEILEISDVAERVELYFDHQQRFEQQLKESSEVRGNVLLTDLRGYDTIFAGNRFVKYALFPETNISVQINWGFRKQNSVISLGKSIFDRSSTVNIAALMLSYGGGGHEGAGTCQVPNDAADAVLEEIVERVQN